MSLNRELVSGIDSREEGPVGRGRFSDVRKFFSDGLITYFPATRVESTFFSVRSVPLSDNQGNTGITATLLSMKKSQVPLLFLLMDRSVCFEELGSVERGVAQMARRLKIPPFSEADGKIPSPQSRRHSLRVSREDQSRQSPLAKGCWPHASAGAKMHVFS